MKRNTKVVGAAGEHFAMYELLRRGLIAALTPEGVPNVDILVSDINGKRLSAVQVKTASANRPAWPLSKKQENVSGLSLFYCFLMPEGNDMDGFSSWIIPSDVVAEHVWECHANWLTGNKPDGTARQNSDMRALHHHYKGLDRYSRGWLDQYKDNWESLIP